MLAALVGYELLVVALAGFMLICLLSASVLGILTRLSRGRLGRDQRDGSPVPEADE